MSNIIFLKGERVVLRPLEKEDIPILKRWINDPEVRKYLSAFTPQNNESEEKWVSSLSDSNTTIVFMIMVNDKPIGTMGIHHINWKDRHCTTGAMIGEKDYWGKGYGTEAKELLLEYIFNELNLNKVCSDVLEFNKRSRAYLKKSGYVFEGRRRKHIFKDGKYYDLILLAIFRNSWRKKNDK